MWFDVWDRSGTATHNTRWRRDRTQFKSTAKLSVVRTEESVSKQTAHDHAALCVRLRKGQKLTMYHQKHVKNRITLQGNYNSKVHVSI